MRRLSAFDMVVMFAGLLLVLAAAPNVGPVVAAARVDGAPGTFTAATLSCVMHPGHEQCTWSGDYVSDDGTVRRSDVDFYGSYRTMFTEGQTARAFDTGRAGQVYGPGGSNEWVVVAILLLSGVALLLWPWRRRAPAGSPSDEEAWQEGPRHGAEPHEA